jgi:hypothetical protein
MPTSRTIGPLHFEDLEPHRFEDLVRQLAYGYRQWLDIEATGRLGADEGIDIRATELFFDGSISEPEEDSGEDVDQSLGRQREWRIQCKRHKKLSPAQIRQAVRDLLPKGEARPYGIILAVATDVTANSLASFQDERIKQGIKEAHFWTKAHLEDLLFRPENDHLLFAYFGISIVQRRVNKAREIKRRIQTRRKIMTALKASDFDIEDHDVLVRDIECNAYPPSDDPRFGFSDRVRPIHTATLHQFAPKGLVLRLYMHSGWLMPDGTWDMLTLSSLRLGSSMFQGDFVDEHLERQRIDGDRKKELLKQVPESEQVHVYEYCVLPFDNIVEVDPLGDVLYSGVHLYCDFNDGSPYEKQQYFEAVKRIGQSDHFSHEPLDVKLRTALFRSSTSSK